MKKVFGIIILVLVVLIVLLFIAWGSKKWIFTRWLSHELGVPVKIEKLEISKDHASIIELHIGNPRGSRSKTAFSAQKIHFDASLSDLRGAPLVIEGITAQNIFIGLEKYDNAGNETNWSEILKPDPEEKKSGRGWLIKRLTLLKLTVVQTDANGKVTRYPTLKKIDFYNISDETGFPVEEIEKAIFNTVLRSVIQKLGIDLLKSLYNPQMWIPDVLPFPFGGSSSDADIPEAPLEEKAQ